ncbi:MAG: hypothetical protein Kow0042_06250 [Calditrichia bacterium]
MRTSVNALILFVLIVGLFFLQCDRKTQPANPNNPPNTTLANIPLDGDTLFALQTLHWDGEDYDGFIAGYQYRYITHHLLKGDSLVQPWKDTVATSVTIPFESSDLLNYQRFQVRAVDDAGDVDPEPAEKRFYTVQTIFPETRIIVPARNQQFFIIDHITDWWQGVPLAFEATDEDGEVVEYGWAVDDTVWNWTQDTALFIPPQYFQPLDGIHTIRVTARDNTNLVDPVGAEVKVKLINPSFAKDILIVDETDESKFPSGMSFTDAEVDSFYARVFGIHDQWDYFKQDTIPKPPPKEILGQYKLLVWHADNYYTSDIDVHRIPRHTDYLIDYLNVGGDFIMSGWRILKSFAQTEPFPKTFEEGTFIRDYLHIMNADESYPIADFDSATGWSGFSGINMNVDVAKLSLSFLTSIPRIGLPYINVMPNPQASFTDIILLYANDPQSPFTDYRNSPVGLRYYGSSFDSIVLGFPLFFMQEDQVKVFTQKMLRSLGY